MQKIYKKKLAMLKSLFNCDIGNDSLGYDYHTWSVAIGSVGRVNNHNL